MAKVFTLKIAGTEFKADAGNTILDVARANDIFIPTLCSLKGLSNVGACRLCMVEVRGVPRLLPACATLVAEGMDVTVDSPKVAKYRKMIVELLLAERNHICAVCVANGHCELQSLAQRLGVSHTRYPTAIRRSPATPRTPGSTTMRIAASCARVACVPAKRSRAHAPGM